jgi:hypothetical protein
VDHRKNLRERVSRLETLVNSLMEFKAEMSQTPSLGGSKTPNLISRDTFPPTPLSSETSSSIPVKHEFDQQRAASDRGHHVPILSVFEDVVCGASPCDMNHY